MAQCRYCGASDEGQTYCSSCQRPVFFDPAAGVGHTLGNHTLVRLVGEGPVGAVYEATHTPSKQRVRLKLVDSELPTQNLELIDEATQLAVGSTGLHPGLPELVEMSLDNPEARAMSVHWVAGQTLRELFGPNPMDPTRICMLVRAVLEALDGLHSVGLAHHDVKPENVLFPRVVTDVDAFLLDTGISIISSKARSGAHYRSPEQARGGEPVGPAADIYGCGALLYEALTGRPPFEASGYDVLVSRIALRRPTPLSERRPDLPGAITQLVAKAMEPAAADRYASAEEMIDALDGAAAAMRKAVPSRTDRQATAAPPPPPSSPPSPGPGPEAGPAFGPASTPPGPPPSPSQPPARDRTEDLFAPGPVSVPPAPPPPAAPVGANADGPGSSGRKIATIVFVLLALVGGGALLWFTVLAGQDRQDPTDSETVRSEPPDGGSTKRDQSRGTIVVRLKGLPRGAIFYVDGRRLGGNPFRAPRDSLTHTIRVVADGHEPFETTVTFSDNRTVDVVMEGEESSPSKAVGRFKAHTRGAGPTARHGRPGPGSAPAPIHRPDNAPAKLRGRP